MNKKRMPSRHEVAGTFASTVNWTMENQLLETSFGISTLGTAQPRESLESQR